MSLFKDAIQRGTRAAQPAASAVIIGTLYYVTDEKLVERSTGSAWEKFSYASTDAPAAGGGGGGGLVLLGLYDVTNLASIDVLTRNATGQSGAAFQSDYDEYDIDYVGVRHASGSGIARIQVTTDGSTWIATGYRYTIRYAGDSEDSGSGGASTGNTVMVLAGVLTNAYPGLTGRTRMVLTPGNASFRHALALAHSNGGRYIYDSGGWVAQSPTGLRLTMDAGNISGKVRLYGIAKS